MKFGKFAQYLQKLEKTSSRIEITKILSNLFKESSKDEIKEVAYLSLGLLAPGYRGVVFNIAEKMMIRAISLAYGTKEQDVKDDYKKKGDLGEVVLSLAERLGKKNTKRAREIAISDVYKKLTQIAQDEGEGSQERKIDEMASLLKELDPVSAKFTTRIPVGKLRLGFSDKTILDALSWMETGGKSAKKDLERAYDVLPDVGLLAARVKEFGIKKAVLKIEPEVGVPLLPALAQRLKSPKEMIEKMHKVFIEPKFDGLRIQIHFSKKGFGENKGKVKAFTRNLNENSWMFPELQDIEKYTRVDSVILDSEAVGVDEQRKSLANFQSTMTRRRKHDIEKIASSVSIKFFVFDILYVNGKSLLDEPYFKRREELAKVVESGKLIQVVKYKISESAEEIDEEMKKELGEGLEGIMVKKADSKYIAGRTGFRWVKMKEEESAKAKLADTIDCVVMGFYGGRGKRAKFGMGGFLVGVAGGGEKDFAEDSFYTITKIGTGLSDEQFRKMYSKLQKLEVEKKPTEYAKVNKNLNPDSWVEPGLVVEIAADEITKSPTHSCGYALRFPRLVRMREDRAPEQATTTKEITNLFKLQKK